jgi:drug/metabolite transporter (DMT)-like permease
VIAAVLVLALVRPFGERLPRRLIAGLIAIGGVLLLLYETAESIQHLLMAVGVIDRDGLDDAAVYGHLLLWDPWWILGGVLFALAGWRNRRLTAPARP